MCFVRSLIYFIPAEWKYTVSFRSSLAAWWSLSVTATGWHLYTALWRLHSLEGLVRAKILQKVLTPLSQVLEPSLICSCVLGQCWESHSHLVLLGEPEIRGKTWHGLKEIPDVIDSQLSHCLLHGLEQPLCRFYSNGDNFTLLVHFLFPFLPRAQTSNSTANRISGLQHSPAGAASQSHHPSVLCWKGKDPASWLLCCFPAPCPGRCGCWATWYTGMKEPCEQLSPSLGWWGTCQCQPLHFSELLMELDSISLLCLPLA